MRYSQAMKEISNNTRNRGRYSGGTANGRAQRPWSGKARVPVQMVANDKTNVDYWEEAAADYDSNIMNTLAADTGGVIRHLVTSCLFALRATVENVIAVDIGCGAGKWLPLLRECDEVLKLEPVL